MNAINTYDVPIIEKELISQMKFPKDQVNISSEESSILQRELHKATTLGNLSKHKVTIVFSDEEAPKKVTTTIWAITEKNVILKQSISIPIHRIHAVQLV
jgi:hypothetical protein